MSDTPSADIIEKCHEAMKVYDEPKVAELLQQYPGLANAISGHLHLLLRAVHLSQAADADQQHSCYLIIQHFLKAGADPVLAFPQQIAGNFRGGSLLHETASYGGTGALQALLEDGRLDREARTERGFTPLLEAVWELLSWNTLVSDNMRKRSLACLKCLTPSCNLDARDAANRFALELLLPSIARDHGKYAQPDAVAAFEELVNAGADIDLPQRDASGKDGLPLLNPRSVNELGAEQLSALLLCGANQDIPDPQRKTGTARYTLSTLKDTNTPPGRAYRHAKQALEEKMARALAADTPAEEVVFIRGGAQPRLTPLIKALAQFDLLEDFFTVSDPQRFGGPQQRLEYALRVQALLPPTRQDKTGITLLQRDIPLDRPESSPLVHYIHAAGAARTP